MLEELIIRTLCDTLPTIPADALFLFGQTEDNQDAAFAAAKLMLHENCTSRVLFLGTPPMSGYPGGTTWLNAMTALGIPEHNLELIQPLPANTELLHTGIEANSMVRHALAKGYKSVVVTAAPFQQPRAFMAAATAAMRHYPELKVYSLPGKPLPWQQIAVHSQGKTQSTRAGLIAGEMKRIEKYSKAGDLATVEEVLDYLNKRD
ncbi:YdcF family protein [Pontibacter fetidus]|uniref:YdcF family protein n=1 Tax=Pontibacter fetidus TaxID=2700082 RepID=A0A6B2H030_9BACT|nr:YdcF family protein [Pontibacter fetidus]NDK56619.1 YdcF family protein [Pontibacter fetidus]